LIVGTGPRYHAVGHRRDRWNRFDPWELEPSREHPAHSAIVDARSINDMDNPLGYTRDSGTNRLALVLPP